MRIERLARNEKTHDLARAFENRVDPAIAQKSLDRDRFFTATGERLRCFVTATAANLHRVIGDPPCRFRRPHLAHGGFDPQVASFSIDQRRGEKRHRFHRENVARHFRDLAGDRVMLSDRHAPLHAFRAHLRQISSSRFDKPTQAAGIVRRPVFNVVSATFKPLPSLAIMFSRGTRTFLKVTMPL